MGVKTSKGKPGPAQQIAALEKRVAELQADNEANKQLINTLLGVTDDDE